MPDEVTVRDSYVFVEASDPYTLGIFQESLERSTALAKEHGLTRILVDARGQTELPGTVDTFIGAEDLAAKAVGLRIAVLMIADSLPQHRFFELASTNRGAEMRTFPDEGSALEWLLGDGADR